MLRIRERKRKRDASACVFVHRFDSEQSEAQEEVQKERSQREKLSREKDVLTGEVFGLRQQLEVSSLTSNASPSAFLFKMRYVITSGFTFEFS